MAATQTVGHGGTPAFRVPITISTLDRATTPRARLGGVGHVPGTMRCSSCAMRKVCVPSDLDASELLRFEDYMQGTRRVRAGQHLYRAGDNAAVMYVVRSGFIRTSMLTDGGREQVTGFHMLGELLGVDTIGGGVQAGDAVALEDSDVCELSLQSLQALSREMPALQHKLYRIIGEQFQQEREATLLLGSMRAEDRLASFLLNLGRRYKARGFSGARFLLRMSRAEIGSYLGLRLETVSRVFSRLQTEGLLRVDSRSVEILDEAALKLVVGRSIN